MIDSKGNPGTGGSIIGPVTEIELEIVKAVVVGELTAVVTTEVMTTTVGCATVVAELCEVIVVLLVELVVWLVNGTLTEKVAEPESPLGLPTAVTV